MAFDKDNKITGLRVKTYANLGAYMSLFSSSVPTYLYATLLSGQYVIPGDLCRGDQRLHQHHAGRCLSRRRPPRGELSGGAALMETAARQLKVDPPSCAGRTSSHHSRIRRRSSWPMTPATSTPRSTKAHEGASTMPASPPARPRPSRTASCAASASPTTSRPAASRRRRRSAVSAPASACGNRRRSGSTRSAPSKS
jgi:hypothetical protein